MQARPARAERIRHHRKYAEGDLQIAEGISESTWMFHLRRSDYSRWFRDAIRDSYLADQAERIERRIDLTPSETRLLILELIRARYTLPE